MFINPPGKIILLLSIPLSVLLLIISGAGIFLPDFYTAETINWQAQSVGQDMVDLFLIMPCLVITSWMAAKKYRYAYQLWGGVMLYLTYTFVIYCFDVHFNRLFLLYCAALGLSVYGSLIFLFSCIKAEAVQAEGNGIIKLTGFYFLGIALIFYVLWLSEILPSVLNNITPAILEDVGLYTNPVHVLDLSVVLPGIFITGILILRKNNFGLVFAPAVLMFFILMDLTISFLVLLIFWKGLEGNPAIALVMIALAVISFIILKLFIKQLHLKSFNV